MHKYADDTYIVIPASNAQSRKAELGHVAEWARGNNLKPNRAKSVEIIFQDGRRKSQTQYPPTLSDIQRETQIKILGITVTNHFLSVNMYVTLFASVDHGLFFLHHGVDNLCTLLKFLQIPVLQIQLSLRILHLNLRPSGPSSSFKISTRKIKMKAK